ncbi:MAG: hypothetical protein BRC58_00340 [Cyanobacteria bacterium QS_8_64_29]|nr:MAG: hypothetical protein BRC58_00340 [Cyanobacteria bacterium QS_8_64_29]
MDPFPKASRRARMGWMVGSLLLAGAFAFEIAWLLRPPSPPTSRSASSDPKANEPQRSRPSPQAQPDGSPAATEAEPPAGASDATGGSGPEAHQRIFEVGERVGLQQRVVTLTRLRRDVRLPGVQPVGEFLVIEGQMENLAQQTSPQYWSTFVTVDEQGRRYQAEPPGVQQAAQAKYDKASYTKPIPPGMTVEFVAAFDINPSVRKLKLVMDATAAAGSKRVVNLGSPPRANADADVVPSAQSAPHGEGSDGAATE